jgi:hypothetical protein
MEQPALPAQELVDAVDGRATPRVFLRRRDLRDDLLLRYALRDPLAVVGQACRVREPSEQKEVALLDELRALKSEHGRQRIGR